MLTDHSHFDRISVSFRDMTGCFSERPCDHIDHTGNETSRVCSPRSVYVHYYTVEMPLREKMNWYLLSDCEDWSAELNCLQ